MDQDQTISSLLIPISVTCFALGVFILVAQWKIYQKAGKPGWACIIPIYSFYVLLKIVGKPGWWLILMFIPIVNLVFAIWTVNMLSKSFFYPILGFGSARYLGPYGDPVAFKAAQHPDFDFDKDNRPQ